MTLPIVMKYATTFVLLVAPSWAMAVLQAGGSITDHPSCGLSNGSIWAYATGGTPPYSFVWSPAPAIGQGTQDVSGLGPGVWTVTVTDAVADEASAQFTLVNQQYINVFPAITWVYNNSAAHHPCPGQSNGSIRVMTSQLNGVPPYTITVNGQGPLGFDINDGDPYFGYFNGTDEIWVNVLDANGCSGSTSVGSDVPPWGDSQLLNVNPACGGIANGSGDLYFGFAGPYGPHVVITDPQGSIIYNEMTFSEPLQLTGLMPGDHTVMKYLSPTYFPDPGCMYSNSFTVPDLGPDCGTVNGRLYIDNDQDCAQDGNEVSVPFRVIEILPGPEYAITNNTGDYTRNLVNGNFTLEAQGTGIDLYPTCPAVQPVPFTVNYDTTTIDLADSSLIALDLKVVISSNVARPGFAHTIWGEVRNMSGQLSAPVTLTLTFDPQMGYTSASPAPTSVAGNTLTWELPVMNAFADQNFNVQLLVPPDVGLIGQPFAHVASVSQALPESNLVNNVNGFNGVFQGSIDPNDKQVFTSTGEMQDIYVIGEDEWLDYTIRFQNTGTDTAFTVVVTDTISDVLDLSSFEQGVGSHVFDVSFKAGRVVEWRFEDILLPDSNVNEAASHGLVSFRIRPHLPLLPGTVIANNADIFFDFNDPIRTNNATLTAEMTTFTVGAWGSEQQLIVAPNPATDHVLVGMNEGSMEHLRILAMDGREVRSTLVRGPSARLDVSDLHIGSYLVEVTLSDGSSLRRSWSKQ